MLNRRRFAFAFGLKWRHTWRGNVSDPRQVLERLVAVTMHQQGSLMPPLLGDVFCQCPSAETHPGVDPGGGGGHTKDPSSTLSSNPETRESMAASKSDSGHSVDICDVCGNPEQDSRLKVLFQVLDVNGDGGICVSDLTIGLKKLGVHRTEHELMVSWPLSPPLCELAGSKSTLFYFVVIWILKFTAFEYETNPTSKHNILLPGELSSSLPSFTMTHINKSFIYRSKWKLHL